MAKNETQTDLWVYDLLKIAGLKLSAQGSDIVEIDNALKTASKSKTGKVGRPEYCGLVKDFLIVVEDKADTANHLKLNDKGLICDDVGSVQDFAVNGALHYGLHLAKHTNYKKIIAIGVSGDEKRHKITPLFVDERGNYKQLDDVETFTLFTSKNIDEYYIKNILKEETP